MTDTETVTESGDDTPLTKLVERLNRVFSDELTDDDGNEFIIYLDEIDDGGPIRYRLRIRKEPYEGYTGVSDLGPMFRDADRLRAFMRGLEYGGDGSVSAKAHVVGGPA